MHQTVVMFVHYTLIRKHVFTLHVLLGYTSKVVGYHIKVFELVLMYIKASPEFFVDNVVSYRILVVRQPITKILAT